MSLLDQQIEDALGSGAEATPGTAGAAMLPAAMRVRCAECCMEVGMEGDNRKYFTALLERAGWRLGGKPVCGRCVRKLKRRGGKLNPAGRLYD